MPANFQIFQEKQEIENLLFFHYWLKKKSNVFKKLRLSYWDSQFFIICKKKKIIKCFLKQIMQIWSYSCLKNYHFVTPDWAILIPPERHWRGDFIFFLLVCSLACFKCKNFGAPILASFALHSSPYHKFLPAPSSAETGGGFHPTCMSKRSPLAAGESSFLRRNALSRKQHWDWSATSATSTR